MTERASLTEAFVAQIRHELRTPVNAILGYGQLLLEEHGDTLTAEARHDLERVTEAGHQLVRIVTEALDAVDQNGDNLTLCAARLRHALHAPLTTVQGMAYLLIEGHHGSPMCDDLRRIDTAAIRLAIVSDTLEHGYRVRLHADQDGVPCATSPAPASLDDTSDTSGVRSGAILVVDDEEINRDLLTRRLTHQGHIVFTADCGDTALALAARECVDLILLDVLMPGLSGYDVLSRLKADAALRDVPVLMISALDQTSSVTRCIALGADDYLTKPFDPLVLRARVNSCLRKKWARDFELAYLRGVEKVTAAALAVEAGSFAPDSLDEVGERSDSLGNLARLFQRMGVEVAARERRLRYAGRAAGHRDRRGAEGRAGGRDHRVGLLPETEGAGQGAGRPQCRPLQSNALSRSHRSRRTMAKIVSIHSYRGGTGKSNLTANLAVCLASSGKRVAVVDTDIQSPGIHMLFGLEDTSHLRTLNDYLWERCPVHDAATEVTPSSVPARGRSRLAGAIQPASRRDREGTARRLRRRPDE